MKRGLSIALVSGILFGAGLTLSQMVNPFKVLAFLDVFGHWDASLAFVMGGALFIAAPAYHWILKQQKPVCEEKFYLPTKTRIDTRLVIGAMLFGMGWGIGGYCPGPALSALVINWQEAIPFVLAMIAGGFLADLVPEKTSN